jgi:hypothetical protein
MGDWFFVLCTTTERKIVVKDQDVGELSYESRIFEHICKAEVAPLRRVDIAHGRITVSTAKEGDFQVWQNSQNGGFRRFPIDHKTWNNADMQRFKLLLRGPTMFFVLIHEDNAQVFPMRSSLS